MMIAFRKFLIIISFNSCLIGYFLFKCFEFDSSIVSNRSQTSVPIILLYTFNHSKKTRDNICRGIRNGGHPVNFDYCPLKCEFSCRLQDFHRHETLAVLFFGEDFYWEMKLTDKNRSSSQQRWIFWSWEAPIHHPEYVRSKLTFNWTMTYRQDSDIVHDYGRFVPRHLSSTIRDHQSVDFYLSPKDNRSTFDVDREFAQRKNRILWFVSNCNSRTRRNQIAKQLGEFYPIDQFGECSPLKSNRGRISTEKFESYLLEYKFYLAFENANCQDYITEKSFYNSFGHGIIPIVLGTSVNNYKQRLPSNSFLHVEQFETLQKLAEQLKSITENLEIYRSYHQWRESHRLIAWPSNYYIDDRFCDLCIKLHQDHSNKVYHDFPSWLRKCK